MDQFYKKYAEDRRAIELENTKLKLKMVSRNSKASKPSVDDYINNILGSGLKFNAPSNYNKCEFQSAKNVHHNDTIHTQKNFNQSCNLQSHIQNGNGYHAEHTVNLPPLYQDVIDFVRISGRQLDTNKIYPIFLTSGLSQDILGAIWTMINRTLPGQLTQQELVAGLAMIALCQEQITSHGLPATIRLPTWEQVLSLVDFPVPKIVINKPVQISENHVVSSTTTSNLTEGNDEWADFSGFSLDGNTTEQSYKDIKSATVDTLANDHATVAHGLSATNTHTIDHPIIDIRQEIDHQFSSWQDDIQLEKTCISAQADMGTVPPPSYNSLFSHDGSKVADVDKRKSTESVLPTVTDSDFGDFQLFSSNRPQSALADCDSKSRTSGLTDRYEIFHCELKQGPSDNLIDQWLRCLGQCLRILSGTVHVLTQVQDDMIKLDVFNTDKGILLLKGIIEVYRVTRNIKLSASRSNILTSSKPMLDLLSDLENRWNEFMLVIPDEMQIDVQSKSSRGGQDPISEGSSDDVSVVSETCGVCLCRLDHDEGFLSHGLHKYHCPCANLWVNTLDLTLPGLSLPAPAHTQVVL